MSAWYFICSLLLSGIYSSSSDEILRGVVIDGVTYGDMTTPFSITDIFPELNSSTVIFVIHEDKQNLGTFLIATKTAIYRVSSHLNGTSGIPENELIAGHITESGYADNAGSDARFNLILDIIQMPDKLIISDSYNHCLRAVTSSSTVSFVGKCTVKGDVDGRPYLARFNGPYGLESHKDDIYIIDGYNKKIKRFSLTENLVTSLHQSESFNLRDFVFGISSDNVIEFYVTVDDGVLHVKDNQERMLVGRAGSSRNKADGQFSGVAFDDPRSIKWLNSDILLVTSQFDSTVRIISIKTWEVASICQREAWGYEDGNIRECKMYKPVGLLITHNKIYIGESTSSGGGLREVPYTTSQADNTDSEPEVGDPQISCTNPPTITNADHDQTGLTDYDMDMEVTYSCHSGYSNTASTDGKLICSEYNGNTFWLGDHIQCKLTPETIIAVILGLGWGFTLVTLLAITILYCKLKRQAKSKVDTHSSQIEAGRVQPEDIRNNMRRTNYMSADVASPAHRYSRPTPNDKTSDDYSMVGYGRTENYLYPVTSAGGDRSVHTYDYTTPPPGHPGNNDEGYEDMSGGAL